jgi:zinc finger BED domain-containing protein 5/7/8/9
MDQWLRTGYLNKKVPVIDDSGKESDNNSSEKEVEESTGDNSVTDTDKNTTKTPKSKAVKRKYCEDYLEFGFFWCGNANEPIPQCVICFEKLSNGSMKPSLLKRHFEGKHENLQGKPLDFFKKKKIELNSNKKSITSFTTTNAQATEASYLVSLRIAKTAKPHTIGETLLLPAAKDMVKVLLGSAAAEKLNTVSLSNNTVSRRIDEMASNVKEKLIQDIKKSKFFAIQIDESTDLTDFAQLLTYVRYEKDQLIDEEFLFCEPLPTNTTADEIFRKLNEFFSKNNIDWKHCVGLCSDGARAMTGVRGGVVAKVKAVSQDAKFTHCSIHREALATKAMPKVLKTVLEQSIKVVNFIKSRALNSRLFSILCNEMGSEHNKLLFHTEVRWLSRGKVLIRLFELRSEVQLFLTEHKFHLADCFTDKLWLARLGYLADIFGRLNDLNLSLQGTNVNAFTVTDKINATVLKLQFIINDIKKKNVSSLLTLDEFLKENELILEKELMIDIEEHCNGLVNSFRSYFPENLENESWIRDPFSLSNKNLDAFSVIERDQLAEISCNGDLKLEFKQQNLSDFWFQRRSEYEAISDKALKFLMPFVSSYLCEVGFSAMLSIKNKYRTRLNLEPSLRLKLTKIEPNITYLIGNKQHHPSH